MPYTTQSEQIAFFNGGMPILRYLPISGHPHHQILGNTAEIYEAKQVERETLIHVMAEWCDKLSKTPKCVWESDKQYETLKEIKRFKRNPEVAVPESKKSYHGCLFLIKHWNFLKQVVDKDSFCGDFKTSDQTLILGLCEVPFWNRDQDFEFMPSAEMSPEEAHAHIAPFIQAKLDSLNELSLAVRAQEERERELAIAAPELFPDKQLRALGRDLHKLERELIGIYTYVQSLLKPSPQPVDATAAQIPAQAQPLKTSIEPPAVQVALEAIHKAAECAPMPPKTTPVAQEKISQTPKPSRPTTPAPSKPTQSLSKKQARKLRFREEEERKRQQIRSEFIQNSFEQTSIFGVRGGRNYF